MRSPPAHKPPYTVICLGWLGSEERQLRKYADVHVSLGATRVVLRSATVLDIFVRHRKLESVALSVLSEAGQPGLGGTPPPPIIIHAFSNGGAFVVWKLYEALLRGGSPHGLRIAGVVWDSAPALVTPETGAAAFCGTLQARWLQGPAYVAARALMHVALAWPPYASSMGGRFWAAMTAIPWASLYVYSLADEITLPGPLAELVATRTASQPSPQRSVVLGDTAHVQHLRKRPVEYTAALRAFVADVLEMPAS